MLGALEAIPIALIVIVGIFAPLVGWIARQRGRSPAIWFVYGALTGPIALVLILMAPPGRCPECDVPVTGWPARCTTCGTAFGGIGALGGAGPVTSRRSVGASGSVSVTEQLVTGRRISVAPPSDQAAGSRATGPTAAWQAAIPQPVAPPASSMSDPAAAKVLATGVYLSGNAGMEVGAVYAIARVDDLIRVFGPVDTGQLTVRFERRADDADVTTLEDRIIVTGRSGRSPTSFVMRAVGGMRGEGLEAALAPAQFDSAGYGPGR